METFLDLVNEKIREGLPTMFWVQSTNQSRDGNVVVGFSPFVFCFYPIVGYSSSGGWLVHPLIYIVDEPMSRLGERWKSWLDGRYTLYYIIN